jgi:plastocyanin
MRSVMFVAFLFTAACGGSDTPVSTLPAGTTIIQTQVGQTAGAASIRDGSFVAWHSNDGQHHVMSSSETPPIFSDIDVPAGGTSTDVKITTPGDKPYFCTIHGVASEAGSVHVFTPGT